MTATSQPVATAARADGVAERLSGAALRSNGFDNIRLVAAIMVLVSHAFVITSGQEASEPIFRITHGQASMGSISVAVFFMISGLLISASFERSRTIASFAVKRVMRIFPGLWVSVFVTTFGLGALLTTLPLSAYLTDHGTFKYLLNVVLLPTSYGLPGVFEHLPYPGAVNGSLWTLKYEVLCYIVLVGLLMTGRGALAVVSLLWIGTFVVCRMVPPSAHLSGVAFQVVAFCQLFRFFGAGMVIFLAGRRIPVNTPAGCVAGLITVASLLTPYFNECLAIFGAYAVVVLGFQAPSWFHAAAGQRDISYGVYVYAFPVQQVMMPLCLGSPLPWAVNIALSLPVTVVLAMVSWKFVERPAINLGHQLSHRLGAARREKALV